jgi:hypothetical protein
MARAPTLPPSRGARARAREEAGNQKPWPADKVKNSSGGSVAGSSPVADDPIKRLPNLLRIRWLAYVGPRTRGLDPITEPLGARPSNSDDERMMRSTGQDCWIAPD